jgi:predicted flap endonuclease-1-like 5' DNA nuclease
MTKLTEVEGIGESYAAKLQACGITSQERLLEAGASAKGRKSLTEESGISPKLISKWVNQADLARIKGIGGEYAELLECAGVDTVPELATRNAANLHSKLISINEEKKLVRSLPSLANVEKWIAQAKELPRVITY